MECMFDIYKLSEKFYEDYSEDQYPEILKKHKRPYAFLLIEYAENIFICVPFRTNIKHKYSYHFKKSKRSANNKSGLDYTKIILMKNLEYVSNEEFLLDKDEYSEVYDNIEDIANGVYKYIETFKNDLNCIKKLHPQDWYYMYGKSTLPYFKEFLSDDNNK